MAGTLNEERRPRTRLPQHRVRSMVGTTIAILALLAVAAPPTPATAATPGGGVPRYVMMGDSYASGEGLSDTYYGDSANKNSECHRSTRAWPALIRDSMIDAGRIGSDQWTFTACSGDIIANLLTGSGRDKGKPDPQLDHLTPATRFVTLMIGGNDVGFDTILKVCAQTVYVPGGADFVPGGSERLCNRAKENANTVIGGTDLATSPYLGARLLRLYREILRRAPYARLTVVNYPTIFPTSYTGRTNGGQKYCKVGSFGPTDYFGFRDGDVDQFRGLQQRVNDMVAVAATTLMNQGLADRVSLVRLDQGEIATHTVDCGDYGAPEPYINDLRISPRKLDVSYASFHPNEDGHSAYAKFAYAQASAFAAPLTLQVDGPTTLEPGTAAVYTLRASSGNPIWVPSASDVNAVPSYAFGFSDITPGLVVTGTVPTLQASASTPGTYKFTASATDAMGTRAERVVEITVASEPAPSVLAWGINNFGQLGDGTASDRSLPVTTLIPSGTTALDISAGLRSSVALTSSGGALRWGGQRLGAGETPTDVPLPSGTTVSSVSAHEKSLAVTSDGAVLDLFFPDYPIAMPAAIRKVSAGVWYNLALTGDGSVLAWGENEFGELGDGTTTRRSTPVRVALPPGVVVTDIEASVDHSLALSSTGRVFAWGRNDYRQLGDGTTTARLSPVEVVLPPDTVVTDITSSQWASFALTSTGSVLAWGDNTFGLLGDGTTITPTTPVQVLLPSGTVVASIDAGTDHTLALTSTGTVLAWGGNYYGQLGDGLTNTSRRTPGLVSLPSGSTATAISAGGQFSLAVVSSSR